jgi:hypothetical protein
MPSVDDLPRQARGTPRLYLLTWFVLCPLVLLSSERPILQKLASEVTDKKSQEAPQVQPAERGRTRIAEGEYSVFEEGDEGGVGPFGEEIYDFHESWTLWRLGKGEYEVEGERRFESPRDWLQSHRFTIHLSRDMTVLQVTEFAKLKWVPDSGPLVCDFLFQELRCSPGAKDSKNAMDRHFSMVGPYGLLWPISPFSLGGLTREAERDASRPTRVSLVTIEQPGPEDPVFPMELVGELRYLGVEDLEAAGQHWQAYKFSIKVPLHPRFLLWTSSKGLLLALSVEHKHADWPTEGIRLERFVKWTDF